MPLDGRLLEDASRLEPYRDDWDRLAVAAGRPYAAPAWGLAWWQHARPEGSLLRVATVLDGDELVGIAPLCVDRWGRGLVRYRFLGGETAWGVEPLAAAGREEDVAVVLGSTLADASPAPDVLTFRWTPEESPWPVAIASNWGRRGTVARQLERVLPAPAITLEAPDLDEWMRAKSRNFRSQMRKGRREIEEQGGSVQVLGHGDGDALRQGLSAGLELHRARWGGRGGTAYVADEVETALHAAAEELAPLGRVKVATVSAGERVIASVILVAAGTRLSYWVGGFDESWARQRPAMLALIGAIEDGLRGGQSELDLGPGTQPYKYRLADSDEPCQMLHLLPPSPRRPFVRAQLALRRMKNALLSRGETAKEE